MKLVIRTIRLNESKRKIDKKFRKIFKYDEKFLNSLTKQGKETFIRFSNEMPGGGLMLTPNISQYTHSHTPTAIYGYPLAKVKQKLISQKLGMSHYKYIIVYWVDTESVVNLNTLNKSDLDDLIQQIISYIGEDRYLDSIKKWIKKSEANYRNEDAMIAKQILSKNGSISGINDKQAPAVFWNIISNYGTSSNKTVLLNKLRLKQKDAEGKEIEKKFSTVLDSGALIDPVPVISGVQAFSVQGFTLSSKFIDDYEIFENPAAIKTRDPKKLPDKQRLAQTNAHIFEEEKRKYIDQLPSNAKSILTSKVNFKQISNGVQIDFKLPGKTSSLDSYFQKKPNINKNKFLEGVESRLGEYIDGINGKKGYDEAIPFSRNFYVPGLKSSSSGDTYSISIQYPVVLLNAQQVYSIIYFAYSVYNAPSDESHVNPFSVGKDYKLYMDQSAKFAK